MKRKYLLLPAVLALTLAACGGEQTDTPATTSPTASVAATEEATPEPIESEPAETPEATDDDGGDTGSVITGELSAVLPDQVGGLSRADLGPEFEAMMKSAMQQGGAEAADADFAYGLYGEGELMVIAVRVPNMSEVELQQMAKMMAAMAPSGPAGQQLDSEQANVGGKNVLRMRAEGEEGTVFVYPAGDAFFTVVAQDDGLAEDLLAQLP